MKRMENLLQIDSLKEAASEGPEYRPQTVAEVGLRPSVLEDLALKILYLSGPFSVLELSKLTRLSYEVANELFLRLRTETFCQVTGMAHNIPNIAITSLGRTRAMELLALSHYTGPAPVSLATYVDQVTQAERKECHRAARRRAARIFSPCARRQDTLATRHGFEFRLIAFSIWPRRNGKNLDRRDTDSGAGRGRCLAALRR